MPNTDSTANSGVESSAESPEAEERLAVLKCSPAAAATKGHWLRRWRRIQREQQREGYTAAAAVGGASGRRGDEDSAQQHKRRLAVPADAPKVKHESGPVEEEGSTASVESRLIQHAPAKLGPGLGFLVESAGFAIGADSDNSEDRSSWSSTAASAPRVFPRHGHDALLIPRERGRRGASLHGKHPRSTRSRADRRLRVHAAADSTEAENSPSSVVSDLRSSDAMKAVHLGVGVTGNGVHKGLSNSGDHSDEGQRSEEVWSTAAGGYYKENGSSVLGRSARRNADSDDDVGDTLDEGSARNGQNGGLHSGADHCAESVLLLQRTQEALENEIEKTVALGKVPSGEFDIYDDVWSGSVHLEEPIQEGNERIRHLESRLEDISPLIKEKDSRILELGALSRMQPGKTAVETTNPLSEVELLYREKIEAEVHCIIVTRAYQTLATVADDQMALYEAQKSLSEEYKQLGLKLRHAENRAMMLEERAEKLQMQCKELSRSSEVLQLQSKASRVSLFCFVQFILLCIAIGTYLMHLVPSSNEVVPT